MNANFITNEVMPELRADLPLHEVDQRIAEFARVRDMAARSIALILVEFASREGYRELGFNSLFEYTWKRYGIPRHVTRERLTVGRALTTLTRVDEALCTGRLAWPQVTLLTRVATPETEVEWIDWAAGHTLRELAAQVQRRRKGARPSASGSRL